MDFNTNPSKYREFKKELAKYNKLYAEVKKNTKPKK